MVEVNTVILTTTSTSTIARCRHNYTYIISGLACISTYDQILVDMDKYKRRFSFWYFVGNEDR